MHCLQKHKKLGTVVATHSSRRQGKVEKAVRLGYMFITRLRFWILFNSRSPCFIVAYRKKQTKQNTKKAVSK